MITKQTSVREEQQARYAWKTAIGAAALQIRNPGVRDVRHRGYRDGFHGFALAALIGLNYFLRNLKLWELDRRGRRSDG